MSFFAATSASEATGPERPGLSDTADETRGDTYRGDTYRYESFFRGLAYAVPASIVLLAAFLCWMVVSGASFSDLISASASLVLSLATEYQSGGRRLSTFRLTEDQLRQERPLRPDREVSLGEIRHVFVGGMSAKIYASPGPEPDLEFYRKLEGGNDLIEKLVGRLPESAEIEHPSGELAGRLGGRA